MTLKDLEKLFHADLDALYGKQEVSSFFILVIEYYFKINRLQLALDPSFSIKKEEQDVFFEAMHQLKREKPIQYILGQTEFYGLNFKVTKSTLIPRPETEELVDWVVKDCKNKIKRLENKKRIKILDIGTGSGCIAISLAKHLPEANIYAVDISANALQVAATNAKLNKVNVEFIEADILNLKKEMQDLKFEVIVSNPPYVRHLEKSKMHANVLDHEPHSALFVEDSEPLIFYKKITNFAKEKLTENGALFFEINEYLSLETKEILEDSNFKAIELRKDIFEKNRMLKGDWTI